MTDSLKLINYERSLSLDRDDIVNSSLGYPESYELFRREIENIFNKSELLLKCQMEFERLITIDMPEKIGINEPLNSDMNLSLIFTGAIKSGRSSLINMLLNTKVMPTNVIGSGCCVSIVHPKSDNKRISVGLHDVEGWQVNNCSDIEIADLPDKIEGLLVSSSKKSCEKNHKESKRIHVQLPHWLLKNMNIYECPPIDGIYSFDEPFHLIESTKYPILMHVIDASNGLMLWDRTFLAKIQHNWPHLPIFFIINHIDIQPDVLMRDQGPRFESVSDKFKSEFFESESDNYSTDDQTEPIFINGQINETALISRQMRSIEKCKMKLNKLGFMLENKTCTRYAPLSVKEFNRMLRHKDKENKFYFDLTDKFFLTLNTYLITWLKNLLVTSSLELKSRINGVVDAVRCQILFPNEILQDITSDIYLQDIKKAENRIKEEFNDILNELDKQVMKSVKDQLKKYEIEIIESLPDLCTEDSTQVIQIIKPKLLETFNHILLGGKDSYHIDNEMNKILECLYKRLEAILVKIYKPNKMLSFIQYILNLFLTIKNTTVYPLILQLPEEIIHSENKWYKEILKTAARKIRGNNPNHQKLVAELINDIKVTPITKTTQLALTNMYKRIQIFTRKYQETYKMARIGSSQLANISTEVFKKLLVVDFVIKIIEKSFQKETDFSKVDDLETLPSFTTEFFKGDDQMIKRIQIQSFTSLSKTFNVLCLKRICKANQFIMTHKSTNFLYTGECLLYYPIMDYDLLKAIKDQTVWQINDCVGILRQLINAVKCLIKYQQYLTIDLIPENIMLKRDGRGLHECVFFPSVDETSSVIGKSSFKRKVQNEFHLLFHKIGMVLCWILTNDIWIGVVNSGGNPRESGEIVEFSRNLSDKILPSLNQSNMIRLALKLVLKPEEYNGFDSITKELDNIREI